MLEGVLFALAAAVVYGVLGVVFEIAGKRQYKVWDVLLVKQCVGACIGLVCTALMHIPLGNWRLLALGLIGAVAYVVTLAAYLMASREKDIATNWTIVNLSVAVPIVLSVLWLGDAFSPEKMIGIVLTIISIVLIGGRSGATSIGEKTGSQWLMFITIAFLLNGVLVILFRFVPERQGPLFTMYFYGISFLLVIPYKVFRDRKWRPEPGLVGVSAAAAISHWSGIMLTIVALSQVARVSRETGLIVYPITNGLVIPVGVLLGVVFLKERLNRRTGVGVMLGVAALVFLLVPH